MTIDPDSFGGKLRLLVIDKIVIGFALAVTFALYENWKEERRLEQSDARSKVALDFERMKLAREFLPLVTAEDQNVVTRAYLLQSAVSAGSISPEAAVHIARDLLRKRLSLDHFLRAMSQVLPNAVKTISDIVARSHDFAQREANNERPSSDDSARRAIFGPDPGEDFPTLNDAIVEASFWRALAKDRLKELANDPALRDRARLGNTLFGLGLLLFPDPDSHNEATRLAAINTPALSLVGNIELASRFADIAAADLVGAELEKAISSDETLPYAEALLRLVELRLDHRSWPGGTSANALWRAAVLSISPTLASAQAEPCQQFFTSSQRTEQTLQLSTRAARVLASVSAPPVAMEADLVGLLTLFRDDVAQSAQSERCSKRQLLKRYPAEILVAIVELVSRFPTRLSRQILEDLQTLDLREVPRLRSRLAEVASCQD